MRIDRQAEEVAHPTQVQFGQRLSDVPVGTGLPDIDDLYDELLHYTDVLLGRADPEISSPYLALMEIASAYYARALEVEMQIHMLEQQNKVVRGSPLYKFRTGQLRSFIEMAKRMADLGSRRLTQETLLTEQRYDAGERFS
jgi:hypothetical protein